MKIDIRKVTKIYLSIYAIVLIISISLNPITNRGELDDYTLPVASILNDHNFTIDDTDIIKYKKIFPEWASQIDGYSLSGQYARNGEELTWYFPVYAIASIPFVIVLKLLNLPTQYAFLYTNIATLMLALIVVYRYLKVSVKRQALLILMLSINTIYFYMDWCSGEVFMYSFIVMSLVFWYNREYKRAAILISIAGMLNPTIMSVGLIMICEYLFNLYKDKGNDNNIIQFIKNNFVEVLKYGCCYIIGIVPLIYNYYQVGHINLTASGGYAKGKESTISRFWAYLFDLNFGYLPYYSVLLVIAIILLVVAIVKKQYKYIVWIAAFIINVLLYSIMVHVNCGMTGIARYNAWCVAILIFAVILFFDQIVNNKTAKNIITIALIAGTLVTGLLTVKFRTTTSHVRMTPIASYVLDKTPALYNPLHSTFNSRVTHIGGGYNYDTPIIYVADDGYIRKILATEKDKDVLLANYKSMSGYEEWFIEEVNKLTEKETYINVPVKYQMLKITEYSLGTPITLNSDNNTASSYFFKGLSGTENWGTWTVGNETAMRFITTSNAEMLHAYIDCNVFNQQQSVIISVNNEIVFNSVVDGPFDFEFKNPGQNNMVDIKMELPDAVAPSEISNSGDTRKLGLGLKSIIIEE